MALNVSNADAQMGTTASGIIAAGANEQFIILAATATNVDTVAHTLTLYRVPNGGTAGASNVIAADAMAIGAGETAEIPLSGQVLVNQQMLQGLADVANVVNVNISYASTP